MSAIQWLPDSLSVTAIAISAASMWRTRRAVRSARERVARAEAEPTSIEVPGGLVEFKGKLTDEQVAEYKRRWIETYGKRPRIDSPGSDVPSDQPPGVDAAGGRTAGGRGIHDAPPRRTPVRQNPPQALP